MSYDTFDKEAKYLRIKTIPSFGDECWRIVIVSVILCSITNCIINIDCSRDSGRK